MHPDPQVSVVISHYNRPAMLERAIDSALGQGDAAGEIIVVDDGSTCKMTPDRVAHYDATGKVRFVWQARNCGPQRARNVGIELANFPYIAMLDSDDEWLPDKLARQVRFMASNRLDVSATWLAHVHGGCRRTATPFPHFDGDVPRYLLVDGGHMQTSTLMMRAAIAGRLRFDETLAKFQDLDFGIGAYEQGLRIDVLPEVLTLYHLDHGSPQLAHVADPAAAEQLVRSHAVIAADVAHVFLMNRVTAMHLQRRDWRGSVRCALDAIVRHRSLSVLHLCRFVRRLALFARAEARSALPASLAGKRVRRASRGRKPA